MPVDSYRGTTQLGRWRLFIVACLLAVPLAVVQVVPCSGAPKTLQPRRGCGWQVSSMGRCRTSRGSIASGRSAANGYCYVNIQEHLFLVHRLVALAFLGLLPSDAAWQVNHLDGNRSNNTLKNLELATPSQNIQHSFALGRQDSKRSQSLQVSVNGTHYPSISEAAQMRGEDRATLRRRCHRNAIIDGCEYRICSCDDGTLPGEEWKPMIDPRTGKEVAGRMVSSHGRIMSKNGIRSWGCQREEGYLFTLISQPSRRRCERVHRIVARAFLPWPPPTPEHTHVNHKDGNKSNNSIENLEWVTPAENNAHKIANQKGPLSNWKPVLSRACGSHDKWICYASVKIAADTLGLHRQSISKCATGKYRQTGGYEFSFAEAEEDQDVDLPGEEWRDVDLELLLRDRKPRRRKSEKSPRNQSR